MDDAQYLGASIVRGACPHDCPDTCAWQVTVKDGVAVKLVGDPDHPFTQGGLCAKVNHYLERVYSPDRILFPLRRVGPKGEGVFERVSWDEALDDITARLRTIIETHGPTAVLPYSYLGTQGLIQGSAMGEPFFGRLGATRLERAVCGSTGWDGISATLGTSLGMLPEEVIHSRFIILWGTNTIVTNLHLWPFIRQAQENGATVVVIDPLKTRTAAAADWHVQPMPGSDAALALGMMHVIVAEALPNTEFFRRLAARMGFNEPYFRTSDEDLVRAALASDHPYLSGITFERLLQEGWAPLTLPKEWRPLADGSFPTPSGKCEFYSADLGARGIDPLPSYIPAWESPMGDPQLSARYPLSLITSKSALHFLNSSYANLPRHLKAEREPLLEMHPDDATQRSIVDCDLVRIYNDRGSVEAHVCLSDHVRPGVVSLPSGWWASLSLGGSSANTLTSDGLSDWGGGGDFHDTLVQVARLG